VVKIAGDLAQLRIFARAGTRLQTAVVDRTLRLSNAFLNQFSSADLAQRVMVIDTVRRYLGVVVLDSLLSGVFSLASLAYLLVLAPGVALVAVVVFSLFLAVTLWTGMAQIGNLTETEEKTAKASELAFQFVENIAHLRAAGAEERAYAKWAAVYADFQRAELRANKVVSRFAAFSAGYEVFALGVFFAGLEMIRSPKSTTGELLIMIATYAQFIASSTGLGTGIQQVFLILPKFRRAKALLQAVPEVDVTKADPGELSGRIEVSHLTFGYVEGAPPVLNDVSLTIEPGQMVAFVGSSGCGKSTMMKLLLGFLSPSMGSIFYDGQDLKKIDLRAVRRQIGVVLQEGKLMSGSIAENILGVTGGTNEMAWDAARRAGFAEDIESMPMGMHTVITDGGNTLSGGQAQRLLIARALIGKPRIMFLDEATSALDNRTQAVVTQSLQQMAGTRIVIAHRLSTIERADKIYVFDSGRIVQSGTYAELVSVPGLFAELARRQME
jgi:ABC-type bacteriocin/lantibiotic exporter with double-glycine peptidase domain